MHLIYYLLPYESSGKTEIMVDEAGEKDWSKRMFELTGARNIRVFYEIALVKIQGERKSSSICWKSALSGNRVIWNVTLFAQCAFNTNEIFPQ